MKLILTVVRRFLFVAWVAGVSGPVYVGAEEAAILRTRQMPNLPYPFAVRNWAKVTRDYLDLVFTFDLQGDHLPLVSWLTKDHTMVSFPAYVGGPRDPEAINFLGAVVSGSLVGLDMRDYHGHDWVKLGTNFFSEPEGVYVNRLQKETGESFWYDILPNVLAYQINALYPGNPVHDRQANSIAQKWREACVALGGSADPPSLPGFDHTGLNLLSMRPVERGWIEPEAAAGIAWLEYMAWVKSKDSQFLEASDWAIQSLQRRPPEQSALYEVLLPYGVLTAVRMNAELGRSYDVGRLINDCFEPRGRLQARPGWGVISDRWQGDDVDGLVGSTTDGGGYAFAMNTFQWVGALAPVARYDVRYAHDIGKWILNVANAARLFYPNAHDDAHQSSSDWARTYDANSVIAYEGMRKWKRGFELARSDFRTVAGKVVRGNFTSTHFRREIPPNRQILEEDCTGSTLFEHLWEFDLPSEQKRWLVIAAQRIDCGQGDNSFRFSFSGHPDGPFAPSFSVSSDEPAQVVKLPSALERKLYVKVESTNPAASADRHDRLAIDAMAITYQSSIGPFAQGDTVVTFVNLLDDATSPIVLYRPASATTDLGLYGSSHVGILGGIVGRTNVPAILQLDLLKTDYFHPEAYPTFLYYNPCPTTKSISIGVGTSPRDLYDAVTDQFLRHGACGRAVFEIPSDSARVIVLTPTGGTIRREGGRTLVDDVVVRYTN